MIINYELNFNNAERLFNQKPSTDSPVLAGIQKISYVVAAVFVALIESIANFAKLTANIIFIPLLNRVFELKNNEEPPEAKLAEKPPGAPYPDGLTGPILSVAVKKNGGVALDLLTEDEIHDKTVKQISDQMGLKWDMNEEFRDLLERKNTQSILPSEVHGALP